MILTKINQHVFSFKTQNYVAIKQHITLKGKYLENLLTFKISTLCSGRYMQVIKSLGHHLRGCWHIRHVVAV